MSEKNHVIVIIGKEGEYLQITDVNRKYKALLHESLIPDNNLEIVNNQVRVSKDCFMYWFREDIQAEIKRIRTEKLELFYPNIPLLWKNREMILKEPRYYSVETPEPLFEAMYIGRGPRVTLGVLFDVWENEKILSVECADCGGKAVVYRFGRSPLSGRVFEKKTICLQCGKMDNPPKNGSLVDMILVIREKEPINPIANPPASLRELVKVCKEWQGASDESVSKVDVPKSALHFGQSFVTVGNKTVTSDTIANLLTTKGKDTE